MDFREDSNEEPVIKVSKQSYVALALHPFEHRNVYQFFIYDPNRDIAHSQQKNKPELEEWKLDIRDSIFDSIPGVEMVVFSNAQLMVEHVGVWTDTQVMNKMADIVKPYMKIEMEKYQENLKKSIKLIEEKKKFVEIWDKHLYGNLGVAIDNL